MKCNKLFNSPHVDHIKPRSKYEHLQLEITNLQVLCKKCNQDKSDLNSTDYRTESQKKAAIDGLTYQCLTLKSIFVDKTKIIEIGDLLNNKTPFVKYKTKNKGTRNTPKKIRIGKCQVKTFKTAESILEVKKQRELNKIRH